MMKSHRDRLPAPAAQRKDIHTRAVLKQSKGVSAMMPVTSNEPLSFLQRMTENAEYYPLLVRANNSDDALVQMELVTAFIISTLSSNLDRLHKPCDPLLGETYEFQRDDYRVVCEQVRQHPPISALHMESPSVVLEANICPKMRFMGTRVTIKPEGRLSLTLRKHQETFTWNHLNCVVHNILVGKLWFEHTGEMLISCEQTNLRALIRFKPAGSEQRELHRFEGHIIDGNERKIRCVFGKWTESVKVAPYCNMVHDTHRDPKNTRKMFAKFKNLTGNPKDKNSSSEDDDLLHPNRRLLWKVNKRPEHSEDYYNFTIFAVALNELPEGDELQLLPMSDCRFRPDIRKLEEGDLEGAALEKARLEREQSQRSKAMKKDGTKWDPLWFREARDGSWTFTGDYWRREFAAVPDIF